MQSFSAQHYFFLFILLVLSFITILNFYSEKFSNNNTIFLPTAVSTGSQIDWRDIPDHLLENSKLPQEDKVKKKPEGFIPHDQYLINGTDRFLWYFEKREQFLLMDGKNGLWKTFNMSIVKLYLFHAYEFEFEYSISHLTPYLGGADVFCLYFDAAGMPLGDPVPAVSIPEFVVNCPKRRGTKYMSISLTEYGFYDDPIPLIDKMQKELKYEFSMCLSPLYGEEPKWLMLIEMIEHYKLQGVDHFYVYIYYIDEYSNATVNSYIESGEVEVITITDSRNRKGEDLQELAYRDCTLRSRGETKWSLFSDIDERLTMTDYSGTILEFMNNMRVEKYGAAAFRQRWIMKTEFMPEKYNGESQILEWMPTKRWHNTTSVAPRVHTIKSIIDPKKVFNMWIHHPIMYYGDYVLYHLEPEQGVVRHYRDQNLGSWGEKWLGSVLKFGPMEMTNYPSDLMIKLTENVQRRAKLIYGSL